MRTGKFFAAVVMLCLCFMIIEPVQAGTEEKSTELTTQIPDEHLVNLDIGKHGSVIVDGKKYTGKQEIKVRRLETQTYQVKPDSGYQADKVLYNGKTVKLTDSTYTAEAIYEDGLTLKVTFIKEKASVLGSSSKNTASKSNAAKTGDTADSVTWFLALFLSVAACVMLSGWKENRKLKK